MRIDEVEKFKMANVVFRGSGSGIITTNYSKVGQKISQRLKPEQIDGEIAVNVCPGYGRSDELFSLHDPSVQNSRCKLQMIYD